MRIILLILLTLVFSAAFAVFIKNSHGFFIIIWDNKTIEMQLWIGLVLFVFGVFSIWLIAKLYYSLKRTGKIFNSWSSNRGSKKSRSLTVAGLIALTEGHWEKAEQLFNKALVKSDSRFINYLLAAKAAHEQKFYSKRDQYLREATSYEPDASLAITITQAEMQLRSRQYEQALASLVQLKPHSVKHPYISKLLCRCYISLKEWNLLVELLPLLQKQRVFETDEFQRIEAFAIKQFLISSAREGQKVLLDCWSSLSNSDRKQTRFLAIYSQCLIELNDHEQAEQLLREALKRQYSANLMLLYVQTCPSGSQTQLAFLESFINDADHDGHLFFALGSLCFKQELWGKAKNYLLKSLEYNGPIESYQLLYKTLNVLNDGKEATSILLQGLTKAEKQCRPRLLADSQHQLPRPESFIE